MYTILLLYSNLEHLQLHDLLLDDIDNVEMKVYKI